MYGTAFQEIWASGTFIVMQGLVGIQSHSLFTISRIFSEYISLILTDLFSGSLVLHNYSRAKKHWGVQFRLHTIGAQQQISKTFIYFCFYSFFIKTPACHRKLLNVPSVLQLGLTQMSQWSVNNAFKKNLIKVFKLSVTFWWWSEAVETEWMNESEPVTTSGLHPGCICFCELTWRVGNINFKLHKWLLIKWNKAK